MKSLWILSKENWGLDMLIYQHMFFVL
uniref:Uncharacterized protein n=1 Tax=Anguilla anguilla TaxID=7936 RepID=A0A0E9PZ06_ANGAN